MDMALRNTKVRSQVNFAPPAWQKTWNFSGLAKVLAFYIPDTNALNKKKIILPARLFVTDNTSSTRTKSCYFGWRPSFAFSTTNFTTLTTTTSEPEVTFALVKWNLVQILKWHSCQANCFWSAVKGLAPYFRLCWVKMVSMATSQSDDFSTEIKLARHRRIQIVTIDLSFQFMPAVSRRYPAIPLSAARMRYVDSSTGSTVLGGW